jgi:transcriptional regulator of acetoin/glycerol metabolism
MEAAKLLGMTKATIYRRMQMLGIPRPDSGRPVQDGFLVTDEPVSLDGYERLALERAMEQAGGNPSAAAKLLGVGRSTLYRKLAGHRIEWRSPASVG